MSTQVKENVNLEAIQQNVITIAYNKNNSTPKFNSVLQAQKTFVMAEINRKHLAECYKLMTAEQIQTFELNFVGSIKDFFTEKGISNFPAKNEFQTEMKTIKNNWSEVSAKAIKLFRKKLSEVGEKRDTETVFAEIYETYKNDVSNSWSSLLD